MTNLAEKIYNYMRENRLEELTMTQTEIAEAVGVHKNTVNNNISKLDFDNKVDYFPEGKQKIRFRIAEVKKDLTARSKSVNNSYNNDIIFKGTNLIDNEPLETGIIQYSDKAGNICIDFEPRINNQKDREHYRDIMCTEHYNLVFN